MISISLAILALVFLCWGSFLNVVAHRLLSGKTFLCTRSQCPACGRVLQWFELIPILSWIVLMGKCRTCRKKISLLYPFIELLTMMLLTGVTMVFTNHYSLLDSVQVPDLLAPTYLITCLVFSALIISVRTDLQAMVVFDSLTLWLVPPLFILSFCDLLPVDATLSAVGALGAFVVLWCVKKLFFIVTNRDGLGVGDIHIMMLIGVFLGPLGVWFALMLGSTLGVLYALLAIMFGTSHTSKRIPFVPFLATGSWIYYFFSDWCLKIFF